MSTKQITIPQDFILGAAASAWQTEGWRGKKPGQDSWIDLWYKNDRHVWHNGYGPAVATDFINRFREDVALMKQAGLTHYRTSINWSRFLTDYENATVDEEYAAYYDALFDEMHHIRNLEGTGCYVALVDRLTAFDTIRATIIPTMMMAIAATMFTA